MSPRWPNGAAYGGSRGRLISIAVRSVDWTRARRRPFHASTFAEAMELEHRSALRWLAALEAGHVIEKTRERPPESMAPTAFAFWRSLP